MAEASSLHGSEKNGAFCASCDEKNAASAFCIECLEYLCKTCLSYHKQSKASRDHRVLTGDDVPESDAVFQDILAMSECTVHQHQSLAFICVEHKLYLCVHCIVEYHKTCKIMAMDKEDRGVDVETVLSKSENLLSNITNLKKRRTTEMKELEESKKLLLDKINALYQKELGELKRKYQGSRAEINKQHSDKIAEQETSLRACQQLEVIALNASGIAKTVAKYYDQDKAKKNVVVAKTSKRLTDVLNLFRKQNDTNVSTDLSIPTSVRLLPACPNVVQDHTLPQPTEMSSDEFDSTSVEPRSVDNNEETGPERVKTYKESPKLPEVRVIRSTSDKAKCKPIKCILTSNNRFIIVDANNRKIKMFDSEFKSVISRRIENTPVGACLMNPNQLAVVYASKTNVDMANLTAKSIQEVSCAFRVEGPTLSIANIGNEKVAVMIMKKLTLEDKSVSIEVRKTNGDLVWDIPVVRRGKAISELDILHPLCLNSAHGDLLVGSLGRLTRLDEQGRLTWFYKGSHFQSLRRVTDAIISGNNIYVCGNESGNVYRVSADDFRNRKEILSELKLPRSLCVHPDKKKLIVGFDDNDNVEIYPL